MTDKLKTFEVRFRGTIKAQSRESAEIALDVSNIAMQATVNIAKGVDKVYINLDSIELLGEVEGE